MTITLTNIKGFIDIMTKEDIAECIKVMQAYVEGKQIQYVDSETEDWTDIESPI